MNRPSRVSGCFLISHSTKSFWWGPIQNNRPWSGLAPVRTAWPVQKRWFPICKDHFLGCIKQCNSSKVVYTTCQKKRSHGLVNIEMFDNWMLLCFKYMNVWAFGGRYNWAPLISITFLLEWERLKIMYVCVYIYICKESWPWVVYKITHLLYTQNQLCNKLKTMLF